MIRPFQALPLVGAVVLAAACGRESPTAVGGSLLSGGGARTFELVLNAPQFLQADTSISGFATKSIQAAFLVVANAVGGTVNAHILARFASPTATITVLDSTGAQKTDTLPRYFKGQVVLHLDTTAVPLETSPVLLQLFRTAESFDGGSATWTLRVDTGNVHLPWATPGGTPAALVDTATYTPGQDSVIFRVDSLTVAQWRDTANLGRGALIAAAAAGTRLRATTVTYNVSAHSTIKKDTVVVQTPTTVGSSFLFTPNGPGTPPAGVLFIGGLPSWRSYFTLQPDLITRTLSCPASAGLACTFTLKTVTINFAALVVQPASAGPWVPEDSVRPEAFVVDTATGIPLTRSPLGPHLGSTTPALTPTIFGAPPATSSFAIPISPMLAALAGDTINIGAASGESRTVAVLHFPEPGILGVGAFYGREAPPALAPKLRLIVTIAPQVQLP